MPATVGNFSYSRAERIRSKKEFQSLKKEGAVFKTRKLLFNFRRGDDTSRFGFVVTRKVGNAVFRNRVKRWLREVFRLNKTGFPETIDLVIVPRSSELSFADIERDIKYFQKWRHEKAAHRAH